MGKSRRNRAGGHRADPLAVKAVKPPTDPELLTIREKRILPVIKDLRSSDPKARSAAAGAVANIVQDEKCRKLLLREQIVPIVLTETLTDSSLDSRAAGWEILRVLASEEEADFCVHLFRLDVLTAVEHAAKSVGIRPWALGISTCVADNICRWYKQLRTQALPSCPRLTSRWHGILPPLSCPF